MAKCLLCSGELSQALSDSDSTISWDCRTCGKVSVHPEFLPDSYTRDLHLLAGWTRERTEKIETPIRILPEGLAPTTDGINVAAILALPSIPKKIGQNVLKLLEAVHRRSRFFGDEVVLEAKYDYTLAYLEHFDLSGEMNRPFRKLSEQVAKLGWLRYLSESGITKYELTVEGIEQIERSKTVNPGSYDCFVAMKFGDDFLEQAYKEGMAPAIRDADFVPIQMAHFEHNNAIMDEMLAAIRRSRFIVADLTHQNQNVYFEAGFAQGLGIPVIYCCHEDHVDEIKFDTQHANQIRWKSIEELRIKLKNRILATIG